MGTLPSLNESIVVMPRFSLCLTMEYFGTSRDVYIDGHNSKRVDMSVTCQQTDVQDNRQAHCQI